MSRDVWGADADGKETDSGEEDEDAGVRACKVGVSYTLIKHASQIRHML
jgi:hypothetical protein